MQSPLRAAPLASFVIALVALAGPASAETIETVAGGGLVDNVQATQGTLTGPVSLALDASANVYVADFNNNRIRKIDAATGFISTIAGSINTGYAGDGGPAAKASLNGPYGVALDVSKSMLYIADTGNSAIRAVNLTSGIITTVAGTGRPGFAGDGAAATAAMLDTPVGVAIDKSGNLYITDSRNARVRKVDASGNISTIAGNGTFDETGDGGAATSAAIQCFGELTADAGGNVYFCTGRASDGGGNRIRKIDTAGNISTIAGTGKGDFSGDGGPATAALLNNPFGITIDTGGNLIFADNSNHVIRKISTAGIITTIAGVAAPGTSGSFGGDGGAATKAFFSNPQGVAVAANGDLYIADSGNNRVRLVPASTQIIQTIAGVAGSGDGGPATQATINRARGIAVDASGNLFISDSNSYRIRRVDALTGVIQTICGIGFNGFAGDGGPAKNAVISGPVGIIVDRNGDIIFADSGNNCVRKITLATGNIATIAGTGGSAGFSGDGGPATAAKLNGPLFVAVDSKNQVYTTDSSNNAIRRIDSAGKISTIAGTGVAGFSGDGGLATAAQLNDPSGLTFDSSDNLYFADFGNNVVRKIAAASGMITTVAGTGNSADFRVLDGDPATSGAIFRPSEVAVDSTRLFVNERDKSVVRIVSLSTGLIGPFAGTTINSFLGDHGPATAARLSTLDDITLDSMGNIYICDLFRIRQISDTNSRSIGIAPFPTRPGLTTTFSTTVAGTSFAWDFGDGGTASGASVTHTYLASGQFLVTLTVTGGTVATITREALVLAPSLGFEGVGNVSSAFTPPPVPGREAISVVSGSGGVLEFGVDSSHTAGGQRVLITGFTAITPGVSAQTRGLGAASRDDASLNEPRSGVSFVQKFPNPGLYVVRSNHFASDNSIASKGRKMVALSNSELGKPLPFTDDRTSKQAAVTALKGSFQFSKSKLADSVTINASVALPSGFDFTRSQEVWLGVGNILDETVVDPKGIAKFTSTGNLKALKVKYQKSKSGGASAVVAATFNRNGLVAAGFDTEGITAAEPDVAASKSKSATRKIQVQMLFAGLAYEAQAPVTFKLKSGKTGNTGTISFSRNAK